MFIFLKISESPRVTERQTVLQRFSLFKLIVLVFVSGDLRLKAAKCSQNHLACL